MIYPISQVPSCSRLAPAPRHLCQHQYAMSSDIEFVLESAVRGFHVYRADYLRAVWTSFRTEAVRVAPRTVAEVTELVRHAVEQRTTRLTIDVLDLQLHNVVVALDTNCGCSHLLYTRVCVYGAVHTDLRAHVCVYE